MKKKYTSTLLSHKYQRQICSDGTSAAHNITTYTLRYLQCHFYDISGNFVIKFSLLRTFITRKI